MKNEENIKKEGKKKAGVFFRLLKYALPYWHLLALAIVVVLVLTYLALLPPQIVRKAINTYILSESLQTAEKLSGISKQSLLFLIVSGGIFLFEYLSILVTTYIGGRVVYDLRRQLYDHVLKLPMSFFDRHPSGQITTRITSDTQNVQEFFTSVITSIVNDVFLLAGVIIMMWRISSRLFLDIIYIFPVIIVAMIVFRYFDIRAYRAVRSNIARINAYIAENLAGMPVIKLFNAEDYKRKEFDQINRELYKARMNQLYVFGIFRPLINFLYYLTLSLIIWFGSKYILGKVLNFGDLYAFVSYIDTFMRPIEDLSEKYDIIQNTIASGEKIFALLDEPQEEQGNSNGKKSIEKGVIEFKDVWFSYDNKRWVLQGVNLSFSPGELVAIVGETGAGKTTIMNLINGMYRPQKGVILIDNVPLEEYDIHALRKEVSAVPQDVVLFSGTLLDNIRLFHDEIPEEEVYKALEKVEALEIIQRLPKGIYTEIVERGKGISAGERQLIALARSVLFGAKIFILDEATSNIDVETEHKIQKAVRELSKENTVIMIAHRLSTVVNADRIIVVADGKIAEEGKHFELLKKKGAYYKLYEIQFAKEETA
ncbi:ABC-type multidrug transport system, ATPase and permease component [Fervidobacterium pennivorans DSM 9078]|uniref:ABC-type multidrug transport system, ATPase and permease component n=1 Tax=Fervidobacterium pennivorans (strain DSM 9078 / Ven5) TaxID=771875 RepID=H9UCL0_FERPD|nr:ABC transporter ATP-binding protein [Fervidobacterium pennivorans]AFG35253.1 ABC-type multidrug transport system, ATPase and permease component [Fervidobacterium pennivorans DSM 9078]